MIKDIQKRALHRTKIIQGQLRSLEKQIHDEQYCIDILTQSLAVQKSLSSLNKLVLENHLRTHIANNFANGMQDKAVQELLGLYELHNRRSK